MRESNSSSTTRSEPNYTFVMRHNRQRDGGKFSSRKSTNCWTAFFCRTLVPVVRYEAFARIRDATVSENLALNVECIYMFRDDRLARA